MALTSTSITLIKKPANLPAVILPNPADQLEATTEHIYNLSQDAVRGDYQNLGNFGSGHIFRDAAPQFINAQGGDDRITLESDANDTVHAGSGNDTVDGGGGDDKLYGGSGDDTLNGGYGDDSLYGGTGRDTINGGYGNDVLSGGSGDDQLAGGENNDTLNGGSGFDTLFGGNGIDTLLGGTGDDTLYGDKQWADIYFTGGSIPTDGRSDDVLVGGDGNDTLVGGEGADILTGGKGADTFGYNADFDFGTLTSFDYITDFSRAEGDKINLYWVDGPGVNRNPFVAFDRDFVHFSEGPSEDEGALWLGDTDANGDQMVYINWSEGATSASEIHDRMFKVHVGVGQSLQESDFIF